MASGDEPVNFNRRSADLIGRAIKEFRGRGRGELPLPRRRRNVGDGGGTETYRLIRGQSVGIQSGGTIQLDNVVVLAGGTDPTNGNPATQVTAVNLFGNSYTSGEWVDAVYDPAISSDPLEQWETLKTTSGSFTEKYRLIRGKAFGNVDGDDETFNIDGIVILAGGLDPRTVPGDMAEFLTITNYPGVTFSDDETVVAIFNEAEDGWEVLAVERFRQCKGDYYSTTDSTHIVIENVQPLGSGLYPLVDESGQLTVVKQVNETYRSGDVVRCDYNDPTEEWEARPRTPTPTGATGTLFICELSGTIGASSTSVLLADTGATVYSILGGGTLTNEGTRKVFNPFSLALVPYSGAQFPCIRTYEHNHATENETDDEYTITGIEPLQRLATLTSFGAEKSLAVPTGGTAPDDMEWLGVDCEA